MRQAKAISKCVYISETLFASSAKGELKESDLLEKVLDGEIEIRDGFILTKSEANLLPKRLWSTTDIQHTVIDRVLTSAAEGLLYFDTEHFFGNRVGLFLRCPEDFPIDSVVRFWEHDGLVGNRSVSEGHFELRKQPADDWLAQLQPGEGNAVVLLSNCTLRGGEFDLVGFVADGNKRVMVIDERQLVAALNDSQRNLFLDWLEPAC